MLKKLFKKYTINNDKIFNRLNFIKNTSKSTYELFVDITECNCNDIIWTNIQRDILLSLTKNHCTIVHLDNYFNKIISINQIDDNLGFDINVCDMNIYGDEVERIVKSIVDSYHITINK